MKEILRVAPRFPGGLNSGNKRNDGLYSITQGEGKEDCVL